MNMIEIINKKKNGKELTKGEIKYFVDGYTKGTIPDYQAAAMLMAISLKKMNKRETSDMTMIMAESGDQLDLSKINGIKVDKHSTGGIGDKTTLVVGPIVASLGVPVAKMSGRALGFDGGTIDKLESIPGFNVNIPNEEFINNVNKIHFALCAQTGVLAPADKKIYALRDVTGTIDDITLIASSIMSKKIAAGADAIVLDVKVGDGAFMKNIEDARKLAETMVDIGESVGRKTVAVITDMDQPLGLAVGNALEVKEAINTLKGHGPKDFVELVKVIASYMILLSKKTNTIEEAKKMVQDSIDSGKAYEKFKEFVKAQGGDVSSIEDEDKLPKAKYVLKVVSDKDGYVTKIHAEEIGKTSMELGAGRLTKDSVIDPSVGIVLNKKRGDSVKRGDVLAYVHANDEKKAQNAVKCIYNSYVIGNTKPDNIPLIYDVIKR